MPGTLLSVLCVLAHFIETELSVVGWCKIRLEIRVCTRTRTFFYWWVKREMRRLGRMPLVRLINLIGHWVKGSERSEASGVGNINTLWRYWRRDRLNEENAKFSSEYIVLEVLVLSGAHGQVQKGACSCNQKIRTIWNELELIKSGKKEGKSNRPMD